jgi:hypothetical protein
VRQIPTWKWEIHWIINYLCFRTWMVVSRDADNKVENLSINRFAMEVIISAHNLDSDLCSLSEIQTLDDVAIVRCTFRSTHTRNRLTLWHPTSSAVSRYRGVNASYCVIGVISDH